MSDKRTSASESFADSHGFMGHERSIAVNSFCYGYDQGLMDGKTEEPKPVRCGWCQMEIPDTDYHYEFRLEPSGDTLAGGPYCAPCLREKVLWPSGKFTIVQKP